MRGGEALARGLVAMRVNLSSPRRRCGALPFDGLLCRQISPQHRIPRNVLHVMDLVGKAQRACIAVGNSIFSNPQPRERDR